MKNVIAKIAKLDLVTKVGIVIVAIIVIPSVGLIISDLIENGSRMF